MGLGIWMRIWWDWGLHDCSPLGETGGGESSLIYRVQHSKSKERKAFSLSRAFTSETSIYHSTTPYFRKQFKIIHYEIQMLFSVAATTSPSYI